MNDETNFETLDWPLETRRVGRAFGVGERCEFSIKNPINLCYLMQARFCPQGSLNTGCFQVTYVSERIGFIIYDPEATIVVQLGMAWDGQLLDCYHHKKYDPLPLAQSLFHLGLLTDEVEAALGVTISNHERLAWSLEHEARMQGL